MYVCKFSQIHPRSTAIVAGRRFAVPMADQEQTSSDASTHEDVGCTGLASEGGEAGVGDLTTGANAHSFHAQATPTEQPAPVAVPAPPPPTSAIVPSTTVAPPTLPPPASPATTTAPVPAGKGKWEDLRDGQKASVSYLSDMTGCTREVAMTFARLANYDERRSTLSTWGDPHANG